MFLLDTDTVIYSMKGKDAVHKNLLLHFNDPIMLNAITLMELYYCAYKSQKVTSNLAKIKTLEQSLEIIHIGIESVEIFGMLKAQLEVNGTRLNDFDLILASCALSRNLTIVTNNLEHFQKIDGLKLANWTIYPT